MRRLPVEFSDLLNARGRRILVGRGPSLAEPRTPYIGLPEMLDAAFAPEIVALLDRKLWPAMARLSAPIPPEAIANQTRANQERLRKTARLWSAALERSGRASDAARAIGLFDLMRSDSLRRFAEIAVGRALKPQPGVQALCYGAGDHVGPHTDHYPELAEARDGYVDVHLGFANIDVRRQILVYEKRGFLSEATDIALKAGIGIYRLPFWHYTTPLEAKPGRERTARRWVLLATYYFAR